MLLYTVAHPCGHLDDECAKLQVIKGVHIDDQGVLLQDTWLVKHKFNEEFIHLTSKCIVSWVLCNEDFFLPYNSYILSQKVLKTPIFWEERILFFLYFYQNLVDSLQFHLVRPVQDIDISPNGFIQVGVVYFSKRVCHFADSFWASYFVMAALFAAKPHQFHLWFRLFRNNCSDFFTCASRVLYSHFCFGTHILNLSESQDSQSYSGKFCNGLNDFLVGLTLYSPSESWDAFS